MRSLSSFRPLRITLLLLAACAAAFGQSVAPLYHPGVPETPAKLERRNMASAQARLRAPQPYVLPALDTSALREANQRGLTPVGIARQLAGEAATDGAWADLPDGRRIWRMALRSPGAAEVRVRFEEFAAGQGTVVVYAPVDADGRIDGPYTGGGLHGDGRFWSGTVAGDTAVIEYEPPPGQAPDGPPPFRVAGIAHLWQAFEPPPPPPAQPGASPPAETAAPAPQAGPADAAAACHLDYKCYPDYETAGKSVAHLRFLDDTDRKWYVCSGALLNTLAGNQIPYFLTAAHCVDTDTEARTMETYWAFETAQCNGLPPARSSASLLNGARHLVSRNIPEGDFSLLQLSAQPSVPHVYAGWSVNGPPIGANLVGIHHPKGSHKRIMFGARIADRDTLVSGEFAPASLYYRVRNLDGRTESGSSGSPLFLENTAQVTGVLSHGTVPPPLQDACDFADYQSGYGRFSIMYPALEPFLDQVTAPPEIQVSPASAELTGRVNGPTTPASFTIQVQTNAPAAIGYTAAADRTWVRISPASGNVSSAAPVVLNVTADTSAFSQTGTYDATITVRAGIATPKSVSVRLLLDAARSAVKAAVTPDPVYQETADADGYQWFFDVRLDETAGYPTRLTGFRVDGTDYSDQIADWFGTDRLQAFGSLSVSLRSRNVTVPAERVFDFSGLDEVTGTPWQATARAQFLGPRTQAVVSVSVTPDPVAQNPASDSCSWRHDVVVTEGAGIGVNLTQWKAGDFDLSDDILGWFGGTRLGANQTLRSTLCWTDLRAPTEISFEVGGVDDNGQFVSGTASGQFVGASAAGNPYFERDWVVNAASYARSLAPGMLFTIAGTDLALATSAASTIPLPMTMGGVTVRINGIRCPLHYVSPTQINAQMPYEINADFALLTVEVGDQHLSQFVGASRLAPGVFTIDGERPTPHYRGRRGDYLICYVTGTGAVTPPAPTGQAPVLGAVPVELLPRPDQPVSLLIGGRPAPIFFAGIPWNVVGAIQVNYRIPLDAPLGRVPMQFFIGGAEAPTVYLEVLP